MVPRRTVRAMSQKAWAAQPWFWAVGGAMVIAFVVVAAVSYHAPPTTSSDVTASSDDAPPGPDWCLYVGKAAGQWDNISQGASLQTATVTDEAHYFDQLAGDLDMVAVLGGGRWGAAAGRGEVGAKQARVQLLTGGNPGPGAVKVRQALSTLNEKCP